MKFLLTMMFACIGLAHAQFSGFVSASTGYHANPLYNYERASDQTRQAYTELNFVSDSDYQSWKCSYVSGLMIFNRFTDRNYYEHNFKTQYNAVFGLNHRDSAVVDDDGDAEEREDDAFAVSGDSLESFLGMGLKLGARHDKSAFKEFDNFGAGLQASFRFSISDQYFARIWNSIDYRRYVYLAELSNVTNTLSMEIGSNPSSAMSFGVRTAVGLKHFTSSLFDTARFESNRTYVLKPAGKGKPGAKIKVPSDKQLLINAESDNIWQVSAGAYVSAKWSDGSTGVNVLYRRNPGSPSRYLAQYANTSILNEDIYNDHFSYEGPELQWRSTQTLPLGLQSIVTFEYQRKQFGAPAVDLIGEQIADHRIDRRGSIELYVSKYFSLSESVGLDLACGAELLRNESNDSYNNYSLFQISGSIGIGF